MDPRRFDSLARGLAAPKTRRGVLGSIAALGAALLGARSGGAQVTQAQCGNKTCAKNPGTCNDGCVCCVYGNGNSRCRPPGTCGPGQTVCPPGEVADPVLGCVPGDGTCAGCLTGACGGPECGQNPDTGATCLCDATDAGTCACFQPTCDFGPACAAGDPPCPAGFACNPFCCGDGPVCVPLCATPLDVTAARRASGSYGR